ncbi:MAG: hypothetical protein AAFN07_14545 [Pseudomonadota bacterium]
MDKQTAYQVLVEQLEALAAQDKKMFPVEKTVPGATHEFFTLTVRLEERSKGAVLIGQIRGSNPHKFQMIEERIRWRGDQRGSN